MLTNALVCEKSMKQSNIVLLDGLNTSQASQFVTNSIVPSKIARMYEGVSVAAQFYDLFVTSPPLNTRNIWLSLDYEEKQTLTYSMSVIALALVQ